MYRCQACKRGHIEIDWNSAEVSVEHQDSSNLELSATVKGYCMNCSAEHVFSIQGPADVKVNK